MKRFFISAICIVLLFNFAPSCTNENASSVEIPVVGPKSAERNPAMFVRTLKGERVESVFQWNAAADGGTPLFCMFRRANSIDGSSELPLEMTIVTSSGNVVYEDTFESLISVSQSYALRNSRPQLLVQFSKGGTGTYYLNMLDYEKGKVASVFGGEDGVFNAGAEVRPQFRSGMMAGNEPFQILLTRGVGLASPIRKITSVYRYNSGKYELAGEYPQREADDAIERLLSK